MVEFTRSRRGARSCLKGFIHKPKETELNLVIINLYTEKEKSRVLI